jgi:predicted transcriptional regulator
MVKYGTIPYMRARLTYVPVDVADQFDDFIIQRCEQVLNTVKARTKDFSTLSLLKLLYQVKTKEMSFSELYSKSNIRMKKSFLNYLHLCINYNFLEKNAVGPNMIYSITKKGQTMLELFMQKKSN